MWTGNKEDLFHFFEGLKLNSYNLTFMMEANQSTLTFLDIKIFINSDRTIGTTLFRKPSVGNSLLHTNISHPLSMITNVLYGQYLRLRRNCNESVHFEHEAKTLIDRLRL